MCGLCEGEVCDNTIYIIDATVYTQSQHTCKIYVKPEDKCNCNIIIHLTGYFCILTVHCKCFYLVFAVSAFFTVCRTILENF